MLRNDSARRTRALRGGDEHVVGHALAAAAGSDRVSVMGDLLSGGRRPAVQRQLLAHQSRLGQLVARHVGGDAAVRMTSTRSHNMASSSGSDEQTSDGRAASRAAPAISS